ncbi:MAG: RidA family protein [Deltaproteobacteria bacterium]|nr:RidA family protein [Deltaproteobacteria bacterium]
MQPVASDRAPAAIGPYAQAIVANGFVFCSGQIGLDPATGSLVAGGVAAETEQVLRNLTAVLEAAGSGLDRVVRTTIYLVDMADFASVNAIYAGVFGVARPARATVAVAALPKGARIEIDAIGLVWPRCDEAPSAGLSSSGKARDVGAFTLGR